MSRKMILVTCHNILRELNSLKKQKSKILVKIKEEKLKKNHAKQMSEVVNE